MDQSHFKGIGNFDVWDRSHVGLKAKLEICLEQFRGAQISSANNILHASEPMHLLALSSITDSCSFILLLVTFIDNAYRDYESSKFSKRKAWHITTLLTKRLIQKIYKHRIGVSETFIAGQPREIGNTIFFACLQSLDIMTQIREVGLANEPSISNELVKYLAMNTELDNIVKLKEENTQLKSDISYLKREMRDVQKSANTIGNESDNLKNSLEALTKRVKSLENKT
jgi:FtsZ-binding cell division protein ZapB